MSAPGWTRGRRLAVDPGSVRVGIAVSDPDGILATPLQTLKRDRHGRTDIAAITAIVTEYEVVGVIVGRPTGLSGRAGAAVAAADEYADLLATALAPIPILRQDERLTTVSATRALHQAGMNSKKQRAVVDQAAAVVILQQWLDAAHAADRRSSGI
ncbi:putative Holliday junction resolvase [Antricoccus suffuscus]|uniref:Putative pre-16S rRNA nuclease n=1 Tax=Antricoccus suffuscus TaxID=1629062 RepID=A0A2T0ZWA8_9ACTN|nr:Holliday junction resolvase RuvX [Antricoccus suffuscus]PRZ40632.1 putative Holliday junction resolvase [Antricoccus suffuscus]